MQLLRIAKQIDTLVKMLTEYSNFFLINVIQPSIVINIVSEQEFLILPNNNLYFQSYFMVIYNSNNFLSSSEKIVLQSQLFHEK